MATTWSTSNKNGHIALTVNNLTATCDGNSVHGSVRCDTSIGTSVKRYCEFTILNETPNTNDCGTGFCNSSFTFADGNYLGMDTVSTGYYGFNGNIIFNAVAVANYEVFTTGDTICWAIVGEAAQGWWVRKNGGNWNNSGTADPATASGGNSLVGLGGILFGMSAKNTGSVRANFGASPFLFTPPSGFLPFDDVLMPQVVM